MYYRSKDGKWYDNSGNFISSGNNPTHPDNAEEFYGKNNGHAGGILGFTILIAIGIYVLPKMTLHHYKGISLSVFLQKWGIGVYSSLSHNKIFLLLILVIAFFIAKKLYRIIKNIF